MYFESVSILDSLSWGEHAVRTAAHCTFVQCVCCLLFSQFRNWILFSLHIQSALFESSFSQCIDSCVSLFFVFASNLRRAFSLIVFFYVHSQSGILLYEFNSHDLLHRGNVTKQTKEVLRRMEENSLERFVSPLCWENWHFYLYIVWFSQPFISLSWISYTTHATHTLKRAGVERDCLKAPSLFFGLSKQTSQSLNEWTIYLFTQDDNFWKLFCQLSRRFFVWFGLLSYAVCFLFE